MPFVNLVRWLVGGMTFWQPSSSYSPSLQRDFFFGAMYIRNSHSLAFKQDGDDRQRFDVMLSLALICTTVGVMLASVVML